MKKTSLLSNSILNIVKTLVTYVFPLITFMYAARIFLSEGIGKIQFAQTYVSYFTLLSMLGIEKYGIREVAQVRDDQFKVSHLSHELLMLNGASVLISYSLFLISFFVFEKIQSYKWLLLINSVSVVFTSMGMNWLYSAVEDYKYITIRSCVVNGIALILLFLLVKEPDDIYLFVIIQTLASTGANIFNLMHSRKYIVYKNLHNYSLSRHIKPVLIIFCMTLFIEVYTHIDVTMLGLISGDRATGLYTAAHKVSGMISAVITAAIMVMMPRISYHAKNQELDLVKKLTRDAVNFILMLCIPAALGLSFLSKELILIFSGPDFIGGVGTANILAGRILFSSLNALVVLFLFIPLGKERNSLVSTGAAALFNFVFNLFFIPHYAQSGAATATVMAEIIELVVNLVFLSRVMPLRPLFSNLWQYVLAGIAIPASFFIFNGFIGNIYILTSLVVFSSVILYGAALLIMKNEYLLPIVKKFV